MESGQVRVALHIRQRSGTRWRPNEWLAVHRCRIALGDGGGHVSLITLHCDPHTGDLSSERLPHSSILNESYLHSVGVWGTDWITVYLSGLASLSENMGKHISELRSSPPPPQYHLP